MRRLRAVVVKELRQVRRDPFSLMMLIALPALMLVLYGMHARSQVHFEAALILAMFGFTGTVVLTRYVLRRDIIE